jgi:hypothetical protein
VSYKLLDFIDSVQSLGPSLVNAQFGLAGGMMAGAAKRNTDFSQLQQQAQEQQLKKADGLGDLAGLGDLGDLASMQKMFAELANDPEALKMMEQMGADMNKAMEQMLKMSPEQLQEQMQKAMEMLTEEDVVDKVVGQREQILKQLELSGAVSPEELARFKADPEYFEQKMRESFDQMGELFKDGFSDPKIMGAMQQMIQGMKEMMVVPVLLDLSYNPMRTLRRPDSSY